MQHGVEVRVVAHLVELWTGDNRRTHHGIQHPSHCAVVAALGLADPTQFQSEDRFRRPAGQHFKRAANVLRR